MSPEHDAPADALRSAVSFATRHRDRLISLLGGAILCAAGVWWSLEARATDIPPDLPDDPLTKAWFYGVVGLLALVPSCVDDA